MGYYLLDKVTSLTAGERASGIKCVTLSDEILHDHFPGYPMLPGALVVEAAAQLAGFLLEMSFNRPDQPVVRAMLVQIERAKFYDPIGPGDTLVIEARIESTREASAQVAFEGRVADRVAARGQLTFVLRAIDEPRIHEQRRNVYALWTRDFSPPLVLP
jgi:3-hydroxymyristoyl/3-hydroxydecanoyl-(acyl carrier protein) dehydratase